jgi:hypothetical protein
MVLFSFQDILALAAIAPCFSDELYLAEPLLVQLPSTGVTTTPSSSPKAESDFNMIHAPDT